MEKGRTNRIAKRENEGKDKMSSDKDIEPKYLSVTDQIMNAYRNIKRKDSKRLRRPKGHAFGGSPRVFLVI